MKLYARILVYAVAWAAVVFSAPFGAHPARAASPVAATASTSATANPSAAAPHANPRLKLSYRQFSISNLDASDVPLSGVELDVYPLSTRWVRAGLELEAGSGQATLSGQSVSARYGLMGVTGGFQYPARVTPFVEGRLVGGVLGGTLDGPIAVPGTSVTLSGSSAATWIYGRGIDVGADLFVIGRAYVSASMGWLRTTWGGVNYAATMQDPSGGIRFKDLTADSFTLKVGLGI